MANLISLQLPLTHPSTYRVSFMAQASGLVTLEIMTVLPIQHKGAQVQTDTNLDISQNIGRFINCTPVVSPTVQPIFLTETLKLSKISKSPGHDEQPVHTSDCGEKSLSSSLFSTPVKDTKDGPTQGDGLITFHSLSVSSQLLSLSQDSIGTFVLNSSLIHMVLPQQNRPAIDAYGEILEVFHFDQDIHYQGQSMYFVCMRWFRQWDREKEAVWETFGNSVGVRLWELNEYINVDTLLPALIDPTWIQNYIALKTVSVGPNHEKIDV
ncbi:hypothetical protein EDC04DRAFT_2899728 [Pisolithus marmoratus]|nr:hypothetical protein EDC04DRAFT_2899728 [Pisolithus marmoratus]